MLRFPLDFFILFILLFWRSPTYLDFTLRRRRRRWTVCYSAQVTAISIYFCTLPCTPTFALFLQREMHIQFTIIFAHFYWTAQTHSHARTHEHERLHWYSVFFPLWPLFSPYLDVILGRLLTAGCDGRFHSISNRKSCSLHTNITHTRSHAEGEISLYFLLLQNSKFQNFIILFPLFRHPKSK